MKTTAARFPLVLFLAVLACGGCYPCHFTDRPGVKGRVVDARTHKPVPNAKIGMSAGIHSLPSYREGSAVTSVEGSFRIAPEQTWGINFLLPIDYTKWHVRLQVTGPVHVTFHAPHYTPAKREFTASHLGPAMTDFGEIPHLTL